MSTLSERLSTSVDRGNDEFLVAMDAAPVAVSVVDSQLRLRALNLRARAAFGPDHLRIGDDISGFVPRVWPEPLASEILARYRRTLETGEPYVGPVMSEVRSSTGRFESYEWELQRVRLPDGSFGVACYFQEVTRVREAEALLESAGKRDAFLVTLNDRLRAMSEPSAIMTAAAEVFSRHLGLSQAGYAEVEVDGDSITVGGEYTDGELPVLRGRYRLTDFGEGYGPVLRSGRELFIEDVPHDPRGPAGGSEMVRAFRVRAGAAMPLIKGGRLVAYFYAADAKPRAWTAWERELMREVAERTWAAVERARAENETSERERQFEALINQSPLGVYLVDANFSIRQANQAALALFGDIPNLIGRDFHEVIQIIWGPEEGSAITQRFRHTLATGEPYVVEEFSALRRDRGVYEHYEWRIDRIPLPPDDYGVVCYFRDISAAVNTREVIAATEARYRTLFESIDEAFAMLEILFDGDTAVDIALLETNSSFDRQTGMSGMAGHRVREFFPDFDPWWLETLGRVATTGTSTRIDHRVEVLGRWFDVYASHVGDASSRRVAVVFNDISERKRTEAALRASEARHAYLLELSDALRPLSDAAAIQRTAASVLGSHLGVSRAVHGELIVELGGASFRLEAADYCAPGVESLDARFHGGDFDEFGSVLLEHAQRGVALVVGDVSTDVRISERARAAHLACGIAAFIVVPLLQRDARVGLISVHSAVPRTWTADDVALVAATGERTWAEVQRGRAEARLRETQARLELALDAATMGTFSWHVADDRLEADSRIRKLLGVPESQACEIGVMLNDSIHPDDRARYAHAVRAAADPCGGGTLRQDFRVVHDDGSVHWLATTAQMIFDEPPRCSGRLVGMLADITERKAIEEALREREERLKDGDRRKDEFLAILAHELRNPLGPIRTGLELIRLADNDPDSIERVRAMMERQVSHMVRLIDDLLDVSRITSGKIRLQRQAASLETMVHTAVDANRAAFSERQIDFRVSLPDAPVLLDVDPTRFVQIVSNLLNNAVKFTNAAGRIEVAARLEPPFLRLTVTDSGSGISRELLPRVFDLFAQGEESSSSQTGLGIGLALARRLVEMHGGTIEAQSPGPGLGSTFTVRMPLATTLVETPPLKPSIPPAKLRRRVVVIDDNHDAADSLKMFVKAIGSECRVAYDGLRGLEQVVEFRPHLILLDLGMPRVDGYETCRRIRKQLGAGVVIVAVSGWGQERDKLAARKAGFDAHLTKPVDPVVLKSLLANANGE